MPNIAFITGGELETHGGWMWTNTPIFSSDPPLSGVAGAHGKVYDTSIWPLLRIAFDPTSIVTARARIMVQNSVDDQPFWQFNDGGTEQTALVYRSSGVVEVRRGATVLGQGGSLAVDTWYELEKRVRVSNGAGSVALNLNGNQIVCLPSGVDTQQSSLPQVTTWSIGSDELGLLIDDAVVDRSGTYLGTGEVETLMPNGDGDVTQLTPSTLAANYTLVDEKPHDSGASYVSSAGEALDVYAFADISLPGTPLGVMLAAAAIQVSGSPTFKLVCRIDGDNYESPAFSPISTYRNHFFHPWAVNPATGAAWASAAEINAAQWGIHALAAGIQFSQVGLQVYMKAAESAQCIASGAARDYCATVIEDLN